jgi:hypothetical protein
MFARHAQKERGGVVSHAAPNMAREVLGFLPGCKSGRCQPEAAREPRRPCICCQLRRWYFGPARVKFLCFATIVKVLLLVALQKERGVNFLISSLQSSS